MANGSQLNVMVSLNQHPLGSQSNENFQVPSNYRIPPARIYVVNHSRNRKWKRTMVAVSSVRGAEDALLYDDSSVKGQRLRDVYNADALIKQVEKGRDMSIYKNEIKPIVWKLAVPGGQFAFIPPSHPDSPDRKIMVEVPEGTWDLYLGNYDRMRGFPGISPKLLPDGSPNPKEKFSPKIQQDEQTALSIRSRSRHNPVFCYTDDGETTANQNEFGILEFVRITQRATAEVIDKEYLSALDLFEVA